MMKVLVACEYSGIVRDAFSRAGHDAWSCDLLPTESELTRQEGRHIEGDVRFHLDKGRDMMTAFPPCTYLSYAGTAHRDRPGRLRARLGAPEFFAWLWEAPVPRICIENPLGCASPAIAKYSRIIQPWQFGDPYIKRTCLWLKGLPALLPVSIIAPVSYHVHSSSRRKHAKHWGDIGGGTSNQHERSRFWPGIAGAMAEQWTQEYLNKQ